MNFLLIASFPESIVSFRGALIRSLRSAGMRVHVAAPGLTPGSDVARQVAALGAQTVDIPLQRTGTNPIRDLTLLFCLIRLMRRIRPDIVLGYTAKPVVYGTLAAYFVGVPRRFVLITGLGYMFTGTGGSLKQTVTRSLYALALKRVHKAFFQNHDDAELFATESILPEHVPSVVVDGSGVDIRAFSMQPLPAPPIRFLMIARLLANKGTREYIEAARRMRELHAAARFILIGWIDDNPDAISTSELQQWVDSGSIEYLGRVPDVRPAIRDCTVFVLPSYREGTPRTVLEAMAVGRPIITTDAPGCRETVQDGENGFTVSVKSVDELVGAMQRFVEDPELAGRMGLRSREIAVQRYDVNKINRVMLREMGIGGD